MAKGKVISSGAKAFVKGGSGHMFGKQSVGPKAPGVSGKVDTGSGGKWAKGGGKGKIGGSQPKGAAAVKGRVSVSRGR